MDGKFFKRLISCLTLVAFVCTSVPSSYAQATFPTPGVGQVLPAPGSMVSLSETFAPPLLKGVKVYPDNPFRLDFILDKGDFENAEGGREKVKGVGQNMSGHNGGSPSSFDLQPSTSLKSESTRLIKYFLAAVTVPEKDLWVNLSPYEKDRIVPDSFGATEMGRDLLSQDYMLKQITASVIYPEGETGKKFWAEVYKKAQEKFGTTDIPIDTFNKVWIVPEKAVVYESKDAAYVVESRLKVMLETDYLALEQSKVISHESKEDGQDTPGVNSPSSYDLQRMTYDSVQVQGSDSSQALAKQVLREVVIPILEKEVNEGKNFARLRQVYHSLILAVWYKDKIKESILGKAYVDQKKVQGIDYHKGESLDVGRQTSDEKGISGPTTSDVSRLTSDPQGIWQLYVQAFKKGAYNYIKEDIDPATQQPVPRKYFSGGVGFDGGKVRAVKRSAARSEVPDGKSERAMIVQANLAEIPSGSSAEHATAKATSHEPENPADRAVTADKIDIESPVEAAMTLEERVSNYLAPFQKAVAQTKSMLKDFEGLEAPASQIGFLKKSLSRDQKELEREQSRVGRLMALVHKKGIKNLPQVLRMVGGRPESKLKPDQKRAMQILKEEAGIEGSVIGNFNPEEVVFAKADSFVGRLFKFGAAGGMFFGLGKDGWQLILVKDDLQEVERQCKIIAHETIHERFHAGREKALEKGLYWIHRLLNEAITETLAQEFMDILLQHRPELRQAPSESLIVDKQRVKALGFSGKMAILGTSFYGSERNFVTAWAAKGGQAQTRKAILKFLEKGDEKELADLFPEIWEHLTRLIEAAGESGILRLGQSGVLVKMLAIMVGAQDPLKALRLCAEIAARPMEAERNGPDWILDTTSFDMNDAVVKLFSDFVQSKNKNEILEYPSGGSLRDLLFRERLKVEQAHGNHRNTMESLIEAETKNGGDRIFKETFSKLWIWDAAKGKATGTGQEHAMANLSHPRGGTGSERAMEVRAEEINDPQALSNYIDQLVADINRPLGEEEKVFRATIMAEPQKYEESFYKPLYEIFFLKLLSDFDGAGKFVDSAREILSSGGVQALRTEMDRPASPLLAHFQGIRPNSQTQGVTFDLYSKLLFFLTGNLEGYLGPLYDEMIITRPEIAIAREGISYHTRAESTISPRDKRILRGRERSVKRYQSITRVLSGTSKIEDQRSSEHARKIQEAIALWKKRVKKPGHGYLERRIARFMEQTVVVEYDSDLPLIIADTEHNVARFLQIERQTRGFVFSSAFLDVASPEEIAIWLNFGQEWLDIYGGILSKQEEQDAYEVVEEERAKLNAHFFSVEDTHLLSTEALKSRIRERMRAHVLKRSQHFMELIILNEEKAANLLRRAEEKLKMNASLQRDGNFRLLARNEFSKALVLLRGLLNMYEAMGMHTRAEKTFYDIVYATAGVQFYDPGGFLPHSLQIDLVFIALRLGLWRDFLNELDILFTAKTDASGGVKSEFREGLLRKGYPRPLYVENISPMKYVTDSVFLRRKLRTVMASQFLATPAGKQSEVKGYVEKANAMIKSFLQTRFQDLKVEGFSPGGEEVGKESAMVAIHNLNFGQQARILTTLPLSVKFDHQTYNLVERKGRGFVVTPTSPEKLHWGYNHTTLEAIEQSWGVALYEKIKAFALAHPDRIITVLDWGCGEGVLLSDLLQKLTQEGIRNVRLIGFSNLYYPQWKEKPAGVEFILDDYRNLARYFDPNGLDIVVSHMALPHLDKPHAHVLDLSDWLTQSGFILFNELKHPEAIAKESDEEIADFWMELQDRGLVAHHKQLKELEGCYHSLMLVAKTKDEPAEDFQKAFDRIGVEANQMKAGKEAAMNASQGGKVDMESMVRSGVRILGEGPLSSKMGNKEAGFLTFKRLGLPFPPGIVLSESLVKAIREASPADAERFLSFINEELKRAGIVVAESRFSVRSNPKNSMPGILKTVTDTNDLLSAIREVAQSWDDQIKAGIGDSKGSPIIIQKWISGRHSIGYETQRLANPSLPLYAAGAFSTRNPNTNETSLFGKHLENAKGEALMTIGRRGDDINQLKQTAPDIYRQLLDAQAKLEKDTGPQEVEFVVNDGKLFFLQTRRINFAPQAELAYIKELFTEGDVLAARFYLESLQMRLGSRKLYQVKEGVEAKVLARGVASTPGALQGYLAWDMKKARQLISESKPVIFVTHEGNRREALDLVYSYPHSGLVTSYGDSSLHEVDLVRYSGIPSLINLLEVAEWRLTGDNQGIVLKNGQVIKEGDSVVIDGDKNALFISEGDVLKENELMEEIEEMQSSEDSREDSTDSFDGSFYYMTSSYSDSYRLDYRDPPVDYSPKDKVEEKARKAAKEIRERIKQQTGVEVKISIQTFSLGPEGHHIENFLVKLQMKVPRENYKKVKDSFEQAMAGQKGGIDLTRDKMGLEVETSGSGGVSFQFDPAMIQQLKDASGLTPVIIDIQPMTTSVPVFLGLSDTKAEKPLASLPILPREALIRKERIVLTESNS